MKKWIPLLALCLCMIINKAWSQTVYEWGIKPSELLFRNIETDFGFGNTRYRYGIILSYRPSYADSAVVEGAWGGGLPPFTGGYVAQNYENPVHRSVTIGFYYKLYSVRHPKEFNEMEVFYRDWHCNKAYVKFYDGEKIVPAFKGIRTENINVFGLKWLTGETFQLKSKKNKLRPYLDIYGGAGIRYQAQHYQTFDGDVENVHYTYLSQHFGALVPSLHMGIRIGLMK